MVSLLNENQLVGFWNERKEKLKEKYLIITDENLKRNFIQL